jgi:hypothetical protein
LVSAGTPLALPESSVRLAGRSAFSPGHAAPAGTGRPPAMSTRYLPSDQPRTIPVEPFSGAPSAELRPCIRTIRPIATPGGEVGIARSPPPVPLAPPTFTPSALAATIVAAVASPWSASSSATASPTSARASAAHSGLSKGTRRA